MLSSLLYLHIAGSFVFIIYVLIALGMIISCKGNIYNMQRAALIIGGHQVLTGIGLGIVSPNLTMLAVCIRGLSLIAVLYVLSFTLSRRLAYAQQDI